MLRFVLKDSPYMLIYMVLTKRLNATDVVSEVPLAEV
jgi:hypothetical protein